MDVLVLAAEQATGPVSVVPVTTGYGICGVVLDWDTKTVMVTVIDNNGTRSQYAYQDTQRSADILARLCLVSPKTLQAELFSILIEDGHVPDGVIQDSAQANLKPKGADIIAETPPPYGVPNAVP